MGRKGCCIMGEDKWTKMALDGRREELDCEGP